MAQSSNAAPGLKKQKTFNRYDALLAEVHRLQLSKLKLLQTASAEMQKLRTFIRFLCQIDQQKQLSPEILKEIEQFETTQNDALSHSASMGDNDELLSTTIQLYNTEYLSNFSNFMDLQQEIQRLRDSKFQLLRTTNTEINGMRDTIRSLTTRIMTRLDPNYSARPATKTTPTSQNNEKQTNKVNKPSPHHSKSSIPKHTANDELLHDYKQLGQDEDIVNVMLIGTKCSGKTALLRNIMYVYGEQNALFKNIKNAHYIIINCIVESIYAVLLEHDFFQSDKHRTQLKLSEDMKTAIQYFQQNRLSKYNGPFLTKAISKHIKVMFAVPDSAEHDDQKETILNDTNDYFVRLVFRNHACYRNMYYFYQNIDKYCKSNWYRDENQPVSQQELLLVWDRNTQPIYYYDMVLDASQSGIVYRFWDISSSVLYAANSRYKNNLKALFEHIKASCVLYLTSPIFNYQIEREEQVKHNVMEQTAMRKSMDYFQAMFEKQDEAEKIMMEELKEEELEGLNDDVLKLARSKWELTPIIALLNKCDIFQMDMESLWDESKTILLTFPEYDGEQSYDGIINYLKIMFKSFKMSHKRPYHIHEMIAIDDTRVKKIMHHIKTVTNLYTSNKRLVHQMNAAQALNV